MDNVEVSFRVACPCCGEFGQVFVAYPDVTRPVVVRFACPNQMIPDHGYAADDDLLRLVPKQFG